MLGNTLVFSCNFYSRLITNIFRGINYACSFPLSFAIDHRWTTELKRCKNQWLITAITVNVSGGFANFVANKNTRMEIFKINHTEGLTLLFPCSWQIFILNLYGIKETRLNCVLYLLNLKKISGKIMLRVINIFICSIMVFPAFGAY